MDIDDDIKSLCGNPSAQRRAQLRIEAARDAWLGSSDVVRFLDELAAYGAGAAFDHGPCLPEAATRLASARHLVEPLTDALMEALREEPLAQVPFRHQKNAGTSILQLATRGRAALVLLAYDSSIANGSTETATFSDVERHEIVLGGAADLELATIAREWPDRAAIDRHTQRVVAGDTLHLAPNQARMVRTIHRRLVLLRIARTPPVPGPSRVFRLDDGRLLHRASGDRVESQRELAMALLGRMGRTDAAPALAAQSRSGSDHLRWQAIRECLALDTATGFDALLRIARDAEDTLATPAQALRAHLVETYPELAAKESEPCPA